MALELERFERQFTYPLGQGRSFHISHQGDPWRFFEAMGHAAYALAIQDGRILGALGASLCRMSSIDSPDETMLYLGDLKVTSSARGGPLLLGLIRAITAWTAERASSAFAVIMDGTAVTPDRYSGRLGIPAFSAQASQTLLWITTGSSPAPDVATATAADRSTSQLSSCQLVAPALGEAAFARLARGRFRGFAHEDAMRSWMTPQWLLGLQGAYCGRLEDTLRSKRLCADDGAEMRSAHLAYVGFSDLQGLLALLASARSLAAQSGYPMLFVALEPQVAAAVAPLLGTCLRSLAPATIFACGLDAPLVWHLNTSDI